MNENIELYKHIYQDSEMATFTLTKLLEELKEKDNKIKSIVEEVLKKYEHYLKESKNYLLEHNASLDESGKMAKRVLVWGLEKK